MSRRIRTHLRRLAGRQPLARRRPRSELVLGMMSGTSGDGVDVACVRIEGAGERMKPRVLWHRHRPFAPDLRRRLLAVMAPAETTTQEIARLHADLGEAYADAACRAITQADRRERPSLIGLPGQTVCHLPGPLGQTIELQLGEPARVAARTGLPVVAEFRQSDVAAGGQGAPLVPWTDWVIFRNQNVSRAVQNIGGIANVTWLPAGCRPHEVVAFDTGPGNMIIDALVRHTTGGREHMDRDGRRAARGRVIEEVVMRWLNHAYFLLKPPKTTGRETFGEVFAARALKRLTAAGRRPEDWIATATALTARSIASAYRRFLPGLLADAGKSRAGRADRKNRKSGPISGTFEIVVCGGGARNRTLLAMLRRELPEARVRQIDEFGVSSQAKEALSFAMLAKAFIDQVPANLPQVTGAARPVVMGRLVEP